MGYLLEETKKIMNRIMPLNGVFSQNIPSVEQVKYASKITLKVAAAAALIFCSYQCFLIGGARYVLAGFLANQCVLKFVNHTIFNSRSAESIHRSMIIGCVVLGTLILSGSLVEIKHLIFSFTTQFENLETLEEVIMSLGWFTSLLSLSTFMILSGGEYLLKALELSETNTPEGLQQWVDSKKRALVKQTLLPDITNYGFNYLLWQKGIDPLYEILHQLFFKIKAFDNIDQFLKKLERLYVVDADSSDFKLLKSFFWGWLVELINKGNEGDKERITLQTFIYLTQWNAGDESKVFLADRNISSTLIGYNTDCWKEINKFVNEKTDRDESEISYLEKLTTDLENLRIEIDTLGDNRDETYWKDFDQEKFNRLDQQALKIKDACNSLLKKVNFVRTLKDLDLKQNEFKDIYKEIISTYNDEAYKCYSNHLNKVYNHEVFKKIGSIRSHLLSEKIDSQIPVWDYLTSNFIVTIEDLKKWTQTTDLDALDARLTEWGMSTMQSLFDQKILDMQECHESIKNKKKVQDKICNHLEMKLPPLVRVQTRQTLEFVKVLKKIEHLVLSIFAFVISQLRIAIPLIAQPGATALGIGIGFISSFFTSKYVEYLYKLRCPPNLVHLVDTILRFTNPLSTHNFILTFTRPSRYKQKFLELGFQMLWVTTISNSPFTAFFNGYGLGNELRARTF
jgi:hypothetical protein